MNDARRDEILKTFGSRLKEAREKRGFSVSRLAMELGVSRAAIRYYERGEREPGISMLVTLCEKLGKSPNDLLGGKWST